MEPVPEQNREGTVDFISCDSSGVSIGGNNTVDAAGAGEGPRAQPQVGTPQRTRNSFFRDQSRHASLPQLKVESMGLVNKSRESSVEFANTIDSKISETLQSQNHLGEQTL